MGCIPGCLKKKDDEDFRPISLDDDGFRPFGSDFRPIGSDDDGFRPFGSDSRPIGSEDDGFRPFGSDDDGFRPFGSDEDFRPIASDDDGFRPFGSDVDRNTFPRLIDSRPIGPGWKLLTPMTRTYKEAVNRLLEKKERDLELAARTEQILLQKNRVLTDKYENLKEQLTQTTERLRQLKHEATRKTELLQALTQNDTESDTNESTPCGNQDGLYALVACQLKVKVKKLEEENIRLRRETAHLSAETSDVAEKESKFVSDSLEPLGDAKSQCIKTEECSSQKEEITGLRAQLVDIQHETKVLASENVELNKPIEASQISQRKLTCEDLKEKHDEPFELLEENQDELLRLHKTQKPGVAKHSYLSASLRSIPSDSRTECSRKNENDFSHNLMSADKKSGAQESSTTPKTCDTSASTMSTGSVRSGLSPFPGSNSISYKLPEKHKKVEPLEESFHQNCYYLHQERKYNNIEGESFTSYGAALLGVEHRYRNKDEIVQLCEKLIKIGDIIKLRCLIGFYFKTEESKNRINLLLVAAAFGSTGICTCLLQHGFPLNEEIIDVAISRTLFGCIDLNKHSPLSIAMKFKQLENIQFLVSSSEDSDIEVIFQQQEEVETVLLEEIRTRLESKYKNKSLGVVAGFRNGQSILIVYTDSYDKDVLEEKEHRFCGRLFLLKNPRIIVDYSTPQVPACDLSVEQIEVARQIINTNAPSLWSHHSNLNVITIQVLPEDKRKDDLPEYCIALYCNSKGIIPLGQEKFPTYLSTNDNKQRLPVIVKEGFFETCPSYITSSSTTFHKDLKMGCCISGNNVNANGQLSTGSIGPFISINRQPGFLTCAHLLYDSQPPIRMQYNHQSSSTVQVFQPGFGILSQNSQIFDFSNTPCGEVYKTILDPTLDVSIDAAAVLITDDSRQPKAGRFAVNMEENYKAAGFDDLPVYNSGHYVDPINMKSQRLVVKCGKTTHLTRGVVNCWGTQVRSMTHSGCVHNKQFDLKDQIDVFSIQPVAFFQPGDSGSAVFMVKEDNSLECIGMAIGTTSYNSAIVTPITAILRALGPEVRLQTFR